MSLHTTVAADRASRDSDRRQGLLISIEGGEGSRRGLIQSFVLCHASPDEVCPSSPSCVVSVHPQNLPAAR